MLRLDARQHNARTAKRFEAQLRSDHPFDKSMVLLNDVVQVLGLAQLDRHTRVGNDAGNRRGVSATLIDRDLLRQIMQADRLLQEPPGCGPIAVGGEQKVNRVAIAVHRSIQVLAVTGDFDVALFAPAYCDRSLGFVDRRWSYLMAMVDAIPPF